MHKILLSLTLLLATHFGYAQSNAPGFQWSERAGGTGAEEGRGIVSDAQGNAYVTGLFRGTATFGSGTSAVQLVSTPQSSGTVATADAFLAKYNSTGALQWAMRHGGPGNEEALGLAIDRQGNLFMVGTFAETATFGSGSSAVQLVSNGADDVFLAKFDPAGAVQWVRRLGGPATTAENGYAVAVDSAGNSAITGDFRDLASITTGVGTGTQVLRSAGGSDAFIAKFDPAGVLQWVRRGTGTGITDAGRAICTDRAGNVLVTGSFRDRVAFEGPTGSPSVNLRSRSAADMFVVKYDPQGIPLWGRLGTGTASEIGRGIATDSRKEIYVLTSFRGTAYVLSSNTDSLQVTIPVSNADDVALVKYSAAGVVQWVRTDGGTGSDESIALSTDALNNVNALTYFQNTAQYGGSSPGSTPVSFTTAGTSDVAVASYTSTGVFRWAQSMGGPSTDAGYGIAHDPGSNVLLTGYFTGGPFAAGNGQFPLFTQPSNVRDIFVAKMQIRATSTRTARAGRAVELYPNPATASVRINGGSAHAATLSLLDGLGRVVLKQNLPPLNAEVSLKGVAAGRYTALLAWSDGQLSTTSLVVLP